MDDPRRDAATRLLAEVFDSRTLREMTAKAADDNFCAEMGELAMTNVFMGTWIRPGLDLRARSLVTLGILIALRAYDELRIHGLAALANGVTRSELEEVIYHAAGYAGFPAANSARMAIADALAAEGRLD